MRNALSLLAAVPAMLMASTAISLAADEVVETVETPWYMELRFGGPLPKGYDTTITTFGVRGSYEPDPGFMFAVDVGKYLTPNVRAELDLSYAWGTDGTFVVPGPNVPHTGSVGVFTAMANALYEFDMGNRWTPFVGAGAGVSIFSYNDLGGAGYQINDTAAALSLAAHVGMDYALTEKIDLTGRYTLAWTDSHKVTATPAFGNVNHTVHSHINHIFTVGLRVKF